MGYRHQVISDTLAPTAENLPKWFKDKYEHIIRFDGGFWASNTEYKRYGALADFNTDIQRVIAEIDCNNIRLIYFADESEVEHPGVIHTNITVDRITEMAATKWGEV